MKDVKSFGGELNKGKRKAKRPLDLKKPLHLVLRLKTHMPFLFNPRDQKLRELVKAILLKHNIVGYEIIFNHSHVHFVLKLPTQEAYVRFIREVTSSLVRYFSGILKRKLKDIFSYRPFTRIVEWGRDFKNIIHYMQGNEIESGVFQGGPGRTGRSTHSSKKPKKQRENIEQLSFLNI
mgnify:FL=1